MIKSKICGVSDSITLQYIINHNYPPQFIGFICNYSKSKRFVNFDKLVKLINIDKKNTSRCYSFSEFQMCNLKMKRMYSFFQKSFFI